MNKGIAALKRLLDQHAAPEPRVTSIQFVGELPLNKALSVGYADEKRELRRRQKAAGNQVASLATKTGKPSRAAALAKALTTPRSKPMTGDDLLEAAEHMLHAGKLDPTTAQRIVTAVHLGRLPEAAQTLKAACQ